MTKIAAIQMASGPNVPANLLEAGKLIAAAADNGARLVVLPENFALMPMQDTDQLDARETPGSGPIQDFLAAAAVRHGIWLVGGTLPLVSDQPERLLETCIVFDDSGRQAARYSKMHLFDVRLEEARESYHESALISPGNDAVAVPSPVGVLGLTVGYDLRFPELYRCLVESGMEIAVVPSTFTRITGQAHWEPLLRARAIENLCMVVGAAQGGYHLNGRATWGHSMIVDPWGSVLDRMTSGTGVIYADADRDKLRGTRRNFPTIEHRRFACELRSK